MNNNLKPLQEIPSVGKNIAQDFWDIGIKKPSDLRGKDPEELYAKICAKKGRPICRCLLYVCRSSIYFAETKNPDPDKVKWNYWKDKK